MEVPAPPAGTVKEIKVNTGDKVSTGSLLIAVFEVAGESAAGATSEAEAAPLRLLQQQRRAKDVNVPDIAATKLKSPK